MTTTVKTAIRTQAAWDAMTAPEQAVYTRHYTTIFGWDAGAARDLVTLDEIEQVDCYNDWPAGLHDDLLWGRDWTTSVTNHISMSTPLSERHDGTLMQGGNYTGFAAIATSKFNIFKIEADNFRVSGLIISNGGYDAPAVRLEGALTTTNLLEKCVIETNGSDLEGIWLSVGWVTILNNIVIGDSRAASTHVGLLRKNFKDMIASNNTFVDFYSGITDEGTSGTVTVNNNLISGSQGAAIDMLAGSVDYNVADSGTITSGTGNVTGQVFTFVDASGDDYHLSAADAGAQGLGTDLSGSFTDDIDEDTRSTPWDCGADQVVGGSTPAASASPLMYVDF